MDGPFDPFSYASLAPLADTLWAVTWAKEKQGGLNAKNYSSVTVWGEKKRWAKYVVLFLLGFLLHQGYTVKIFKVS